MPKYELTEHTNQRKQSLLKLFLLEDVETSNIHRPGRYKQAKSVDFSMIKFAEHKFPSYIAF